MVYLNVNDLDLKSNLLIGASVGETFIFSANS